MDRDRGSVMTVRIALIVTFAIGLILLLAEPRPRADPTNPGLHNYATCNLILQHCVLI